MIIFIMLIVLISMILLIIIVLIIIVLIIIVDNTNSFYRDGSINHADFIDRTDRVCHNHIDNIYHADSIN